MMNLPSLLIVDDEKNTREALSRLLTPEYDVYLASSVEEALQAIQKQTFQLAITDLRLGGNSTGLAIIQSAKQKAIPCIMMTAFGDVDTAVAAMRQGAFDFVTKPLNFQKLKITLKQALTENKQRKNLAPSSQNTPATKPLESKIIAAENSPFRGILENAKKIANSRANVLILGETGTGKEILAQTIHQSSPRRQYPLIAVHCAAISSTLLESELFGHEKGAFTGAIEKRIGKFEAAHHGTLFLDEIGEIDSGTQIKLLRFLETKSFERVGSNEIIHVNTRIVSATNRNLLDMVHAGTFREDLFYRLNVIELKLPPLRERIDDIPLLFFHYIHFFCTENNIPVPPHVSEYTMGKIKKYSWPGNIRELKNTCESVIALLRDNQTEITLQDLGEKFS